jgi:hypothetical protein
LTADEPVGHDFVGSFLEAVDLLARGGLSIQESSELAADLDREELDEYFVLLGLPIFSFSSRQRDLLAPALVMVGAALTDRCENVLEVCTLHALVCVRIFDSEQVGWKQFVEATVNLTDGDSRDGATL